MTNSKQLVWAEDMRPEKLSDVKGQEAIVVLEAFVRLKNVVDCNLSGKPGCGKTSAIVAMGKELYGTEPNEHGVSYFESNVLIQNASDERKIENVRTTIANFTTEAPTNPEVPFKLIYLDEADNLGKDAQDALRGTMEAHSNNCRFILSCNNQYGLIEALRSRGPIIPFHQLTPEVLFSIATKASEKYHFTITPDALNFLITYVDGDARSLMKHLQIAAMVNPVITPEILRKFIPSLEQKTIDKLLEFILAKDFSNSRSTLIEIYTTSNYNVQLILRSLAQSILRNEAKFSSPMSFVKIQSKLGESSYRIPQSLDPLISLTALIGDIILINQIPIHCLQVKE
jgi:replication factor C small subunit